jgi:hypothetical protein
MMTWAGLFEIGLAEDWAKSQELSQEEERVRDWRVPAAEEREAPPWAPEQDAAASA